MPSGDSLDWVGEVADGIDQVVAEEIVNARDRVPTVSDKLHAHAAAVTRESLDICPTAAETVVVLLVVDREVPANNVACSIPCGDGIVFGGYVRDVARDVYLVDCIDYVSLGTVPVSFEMSLPRTGGWRTPVPMSDKAVERLLSPYFRRVLKGVRERYRGPRYDLHFMQMLSCN